MNKFTLGLVAGASALAIGFPLAAQYVGAQSSAQSSADTRPVPTQECVTAMATQIDMHLSKMDAHIAAQKNVLQAHSNALKTAATITDDVARQNALQKAHEDMRTAMDAAHEDMDTAEMDALKAACGNTFMFKIGGPMMMGFGPHMKMRGDKGPHMMRLSEKFGMTADEFKAALDSGKTIEDIAAEKGIELPERGMKMWNKMVPAPATTEE